MIPKVIHYCWFGRGNKPKLVLDCIASWKRVLPDYQIKEWNEDNFDISTCRYVQEAYASRKWAFVADYVRLYALFTEGGVYLDSDVEVVKSLDPYLVHKAFSGRESANSCLTGTMGAEKGSQWIKDMLDPYQGYEFIRKDGSLNLTTNVVYSNELMVQKGLSFEDKAFEIDNYVAIYPTEIFCPKPLGGDRYAATNKTVTIHHFAASWYSPRQRLACWVGKIAGNRAAQIVSLMTHNPAYIIRRILRYIKSGA